MFSFNFDSRHIEDCPSSDEEVVSNVKIDPSTICKPSNFNGKSVVSTEEFQIKTLSKEDLTLLLEKDIDLSIQAAEISHSDLIPGVYEGGLKIWECTYDLCDYIIENKRLTCNDKNILDLGCGAGILGILGKKLGAKFVDFHDYNSGVLKNLTIPNVKLNFSSFADFGFWSGDWSGFKSNRSYDLILTSETIYNNKNYPKLHKLLEENLKNDGLIYLAAKAYYFGVGGSISEFCDFIEKKDIFAFKKVFCCDDGVKRAIVELSFK